MLLCYIIGVLLTFTIISLNLKKENKVSDEFFCFMTVIIVSLLFPFFLLEVIVSHLGERWIKWVMK